jgi:hypothetical protein
MRRVLTWAAGPAAALALAGCAPEAPPRGAAPQAALVPAGRAEILAAALLRADHAERSGDAAALAEAALTIERLGPSAGTEADAETLRRWRAALPPGTPPLRGRALGPGYRAAVLMPGAATQLHQTFLGGRSAQIVVRVAEGPAPRLMVRDQSQREVCRAVRDPVNCRWVPLYTQRHSIEIVNTGDTTARVYIVFD